MLKLDHITKTYQIGSFIQNALDEVCLEFRQSEFVTILGPSGGGKTTLLNVIGGLDRATSGDLIINGKSTIDFTDREWDMYRNNSIGFIFQSHNLISHLSILHNVEMGLALSGASHQEKRNRAKELLIKVGLIDHMHKKPNQLSGGQSQRVAIARALANNPDIILADEPTGSLDTETGKQILDLIKEIAKEKLVIMVTHDYEMANLYANRIIKIKDGQIIDDSRPVKNLNDESGFLNLKKTAMSFSTAFMSSLNNISTKLGRTILTAFAGSIGIIGIALILSLSNGMQQEIDRFERETLSSYPIQISDMSIDLNNLLQLYSEERQLEKYPDGQYVIPEKSAFEENIIQNNLTEDYIEYIIRYINNEGKETLSGYSFNYRMNMSLLYTDSLGALKSLAIESKTPGENDFMPFDVTFFHLQPQGDVFSDNYELLYGDLPNNTEIKMNDKEIEILLSINRFNQMSSEQLEYFGYDIDDFDDGDVIDFSELVGKEFKLFIGNYNAQTSDVSQAYTLTITGIIRTKPGTNISLFMGNGLVYGSEVEQFLKVNHPNEVATSFFNKEGIRRISLYPNSFDSKERVIEYLSAYNRNRPDNQKIMFNDQAALFTSISSGIINAISIVLIAFASISLVVSSIMISIITYVSVLERTKEIGVLRALGARKKDVARVFNSENIIIGFSAGFTGVMIALILIIPINIILKNVSDIPNIAKLSMLHIVILIGISILLAYLAGFIPAMIASKKNPVDALRTE